MEEVFYDKSIEASLKDQKSSLNGLSNREAKIRLEKHGKNVIKKKRKFHTLKVIFNQFNSFLIYILIIATAISFLIGQKIDGFVIGAIVILNATIGFVQQFKAEKAIANLKKLIVSKTTVIREGVQMEILSEEIVPGDIVLFEAGDKITADCRILEEENLETNEAALTGESLSVSKKSSPINKEVSLSKKSNMLFMGTQVAKGTAKALVVKTGMNTVFGKIAGELQEISGGKTPIEKRLDRFSKQIGLIILGVVIIILTLGVLEHFDLSEMFLTSVALAVSAIPEGLPAVLAISFAISSIVMSKKNVIVRKLPAVEALGSITVICTDKTGTLTEEKMAVQKIFANNQFYKKTKEGIILNNNKISFKDHSEIYELMKTSVLCNNARFEKTNGKYGFLGDPTEIALVEAALDVGVNKKDLIDSAHSLEKFEFDSVRKMMSVLRKEKGKNIQYSKGAPKKILDKSTHELIQGKIKKLTEKRKEELMKQSELMEREAFRVLGFAKKEIPSNEKISEEGLIFLGFEGMIDPPRKEVVGAIRECKRAGIAVKIITGDSPITAKAVGEQIGITGRIVTELELKKMSDSKLIKEIDGIVIFARMTPEQKLRVTQILQKKGEIVAITGDGVNDALALKSADVGVAMGIRGTDVSRDVSDIVLIDDNFASIVEGVREGRRSYQNIKKFTKYLLAVNFSEIGLIIYALLLNFPLPLLPLQILWMNLVSDSFPSLSLVFEKGEDMMSSKPKKEKSLLSGEFKYIILAGILALIVEIIIFRLSLNQGNSIELTRTLVLTMAILYELLFVYTIRSTIPLHKIGFFSNSWMNYAVTLSLALHVILLYAPIGAFFNLVPLTLSNWLFLLPFAASGLIIFEVAKYIKPKNKILK